jgi:hypothetical protein
MVVIFVDGVLEQVETAFDMEIRHLNLPEHLFQFSFAFIGTEAEGGDFCISQGEVARKLADQLNGTDAGDHALDMVVVCEM